MAGPDGQTPDALVDRLGEKPFAYDFYAAVRLLQRAFADHPRIGYSDSLKGDPIRFAQNPALDFAPATIEAVQRKAEGGTPVVYSRHFGLFGPNGPLPLCLTEYARERVLHHGDKTFAAFCNAFHHRLLSFFFRAWADARKAVDCERPNDQHWSQFVGSLVGLGQESLLGRQSIPDRAQLYFAGRLTHQARPAEGLQSIVQDFFGVPAQVMDFCGRWFDLPPEARCKLGDSPETGALGVTLLAGSRFWNCQLHFRLRLGPMKLADLERLLPGGDSYRRLCDWVRLYAGEHYSWDVQLVLAKEEVPSVQLGQFGRLGWTTWLKTQPQEHDAEGLVLQGSA